MTINFQQYAETGKAFVNKVAFELGDDDDKAKASRILLSTIRVLRAQSTFEESMQFISQLPMAIKAVYIDGWQPGTKTGRVCHWNDFVTEVQKAHQEAYLTTSREDNSDFVDQHDCAQAIHSVFRVLKEYVSKGELEDFLLALPVDLRDLFDE
ncbi:DUF2267 domain-containing protein [bacterium]|nr:DUF2267 domain-containing protein [bacterium]